MIKIKYFIALVFVFTSFFCQAQKGWEAGAWLGTSVYFGDLNTNYYLQKPGPAGGLIGRYNFNNRISTKGSLNYMLIRADDADSRNMFEQMRNLNFKSSIVELNGQMEFNFLPYVHGSKDMFFTPYLALGASILYYNPQTTLEDNGVSTTYSLRNYGTEGQEVGEEYFYLSGAISLSGGFKWDINAEWSFNIEIGSRLPFTDYIDDVSQQYPNFAVLASIRGEEAVDLSNRSLANGIGEEGRQRGNSRDNDTYNYIGLSIMRYFGKLECPRISEW